LKTGLKPVKSFSYHETSILPHAENDSKDVDVGLVGVDGVGDRVEADQGPGPAHTGRTVNENGRKTLRKLIILIYF
jgi:hypothetical protein